MNAIAVLTTITPTDDLLKFYSGFVRLGYRVFVVIDDNNLKLDNARLKAKNAGVSLIQIEDYECRRAGFFNFTGFRTRTGCAAWDKAIYYFCCRDPLDDNIWFIEDDVFVPSHEIIVAIDRKYESADIISADNVMNKYGALDEDGWPWWRLVPRTILPPPWAHSMVCAVRLSRKMLAALDSFIRSNKNKLRFTNAVIAVIKVAGLLRQKSLWRKRLHVEYIFHTLALHNQLNVIKAQELSGVVYRTEWNVSKMNSGTIYHPLKDSALHYRYREILNQDTTK